MNFKEKADELFKKILESKIEEAKLDPVGQEDGDVDNDGDEEDDADKYLKNRRKVIAKAMKKKETKSVEESALDTAKYFLGNLNKYAKRSPEEKKNSKIRRAGERAFYINSYKDYAKKFPNRSIPAKLSHVAHTAGRLFGTTSVGRSWDQAQSQVRQDKWKKSQQQKSMREEIQEIDEISKAKKLAYYTAATTGKRRPKDLQKQSDADAKRMKDDPTNPAWAQRKDYWANKASKRQRGIDRAKAALTKEEVEKHVVNVTVSNPNHTMVTKRNEQEFKKLIVTAGSKEAALEAAKKHYKKIGYKVHDVEYGGLKK